MKQLSLKLDDHLYEKLQTYTRDNGVSASSVLTDSLVAHLSRQKRSNAPQGNFTFIDLFAGIGGMRIAYSRQGGQCVFSSEWDKYAQKTYFENSKRDRERRKQEQLYKSAYTSTRNEKVKKLILKGVTPIDKDKFSYASLARKVHPDFHMNHPENRENATEMMKLVNANKGNLMVLRQYARDWGLLTEMFKQKRYDVYQFLCEWLNNN